MKSFSDLTRLGRIRRMRQLAQAALSAYAFTGARLTFLRQAGNTLFLINEPASISPSQISLFGPGQYLLRIHQPGYQAPEALELELEWLSAMRKDADLPVPEPVANRAGKLLTWVSVPGVPEARGCSILRWVRGRLIGEHARPLHYRAQGELMARLHNHAARWRPALDCAKRSYDWEGLFQDGSPNAWDRLPPGCAKPFEEIASRTRTVMDGLGKGSGVYGLIHADLGMDANLLFQGGEARAIDFDDAGFGYYLYDLSLAQEHCQEEEALPQFRESLLDGYTRFRPLPADAAKIMDLFLAAFQVYLSLWCAAVVQSHPEDKEELYQRIERAERLVSRYLEFSL